MNDPHVEHLLEVIGYTMASHVMARASIGDGSGRCEETLTADLRDLFATFDVATDYLAAQKSPSWIAVDVKDLNRTAESQVGADFVLAMRGVDIGPSDRRFIRKVTLVQAKRQNYADPSNDSYAKSVNHREHAKKMAQRVGLCNAFFAFYHSDAVLTNPSLGPVHWSAGGQPPTYYFASPRLGDHFYLANHPHVTHAHWVEPSSYRDLYKKRLRSFNLPGGFEWGIAIVSADWFLTPALRKRRSRRKLPSVTEVLAKGQAFQDWLVLLAECSEGDNLTETEFTTALANAEAPGGKDDVRPQFTVTVRFGSASSPDVRWPQGFLPPENRRIREVE